MKSVKVQVHRTAALQDASPSSDQGHLLMVQPSLVQEWWPGRLEHGQWAIMGTGAQSPLCQCGPEAWPAQPSP